MLRIQDPLNVWQVITPCEVVSKCLGQIPVFSGPVLHRWKRWVNIVHFVFTVTFIARGIIYCLPIDLNYSENSAVIKQSGAIVVIMFYIEPIFSVMCSRLVVGTIRKILTNIEAVDNKILQLDVQRSYTQERNIVIGLTASSFTGCLILITMYANFCVAIDIEYAFETIFFQLHYSMACVYATSVTFLMLKRFCMLNEAISKHFPYRCKLDVDMFVVTEPEKPTHKGQLFILKQIKILLDKLIETVDLVNHCFAVQVLFCVTMTFIIGVFCCFHLSRSLMYHQKDELFSSIVNLTWYLYYLFFVLVFIAVGSRIASESKRTGVFINKVINGGNTSSAVSNELLIFSQQLLHYNPVITCGLFVYDWSLFYTIIGATATYLIILIQFDLSFPSLKDVTGNGSMVS